MDFYEVINKRHTVREFLDKEVDFEAIKRILDAGNKAPTWNHNRTWSYIILRTDEEKEYAFEYAKKIADKFNAEKYLNAWRPYPTTLAQKMYAYAMPRQYTMLKNAPYVSLSLCSSARSWAASTCRSSIRSPPSGALSRTYSLRQRRKDWPAPCVFHWVKSMTS